MVTIHGLGSEAKELDGLEDIAPRTLNLDLPGFGSSTLKAPGTMSGYVDHVRRTLDGLDIDRAWWLGCSFGGQLALQAALTIPQRVAGLILVSSGGLDPKPPAQLTRSFSAQALRSRKLEQVALACRALCYRPNAATEAFTMKRLQAHAKNDYQNIVNAAKAAIECQTAHQLESISCPTLLIHGRHDALIAPEVARMASQRIAHSRFTMLDQCGHMPWLECPQRLKSHIRHFLTGFHQGSKKPLS